MRKFIFPEAVGVLLKNYFELRDAASRPYPSSPFSVTMNLGDGPATAVSMDVIGGALRVSFKEGDRGYTLAMPLKWPAGTHPLVSVTLSEAGRSSSYEVKPEDFLGARLPGGFAELHEKVAQYVKSILPSGYFDKKSPTEPAKPEQPSTVTQTPQEPTEAQASEAAKSAPEYSTWLVRREGERDLRFQGKVIAAVESFPRQGRQKVLKVIQTPGGKFIGLSLGTSMWLGETDRAQVKVADKLEELVDLFGYNALAKALYDQLSLAHEEVID